MRIIARMIDGAEMLTLAEDWGVAPATIERDYVSGWLIAAIAAHDRLGPAWTFTGGTCLRKCLLETYRFPPTLDFTLTDGFTLSPLRLRRAFDEIVATITRVTGILMPRELVQFELGRNGRDELVGRGYVHYRGPLTPLSWDAADATADMAPIAQARWSALASLAALDAPPEHASADTLAAMGLVAGADPTESVRLDYGLPFLTLRVNASDPLLLPRVARRIVHPYSDAGVHGTALPLVTPCVAHEELFSERVITLARDARPGDLYDVVTMFRDEATRPAAAAVMRLLARKSTLKIIATPSEQNLARLREPLRAAWAEAAARELSVAPPFDDVWRTLGEMFSWLDTGHVAEMPPPIPLGSGHAPCRPALGELRARGLPGAAFVEPLRFAALNRLCVEIDYERASGERRTRTVEPYALRATARGDVLLMALHRDIKNLRSYRLDRVRGLRVTPRVFTPRFAIDPGPPYAAAMPDTTPPSPTSSRRDERQVH